MMKNKTHKEVTIALQDVELKGSLSFPPNATGLVIFSHGSGSSRFSPRNQEVAQYLNKAGFGTLLFDQLTQEEDLYYQNRFNIPLLSKRLIGTTMWLQKEDCVKQCRLGYFGASTGAASALLATAALPEIAAVVSRGGRPDLAMSSLSKIKAPTLLIVGGRDPEVIRLNEAAYSKLNCKKELRVVAGATHLFEEPGAMLQVCQFATEWFETHLKPVMWVDD